MSFVEFYSFNISIVHPARDQYESVRVKAARHPEESPAYLHARVFALAHAYREGLEFSEGFFDPKAPAIWAHDLFEQITAWIELGAPDREKIQRALRRNPKAEFRIYFYDQEQIDLFCHYLRGSTSNWVAPVQFYLLDRRFLEQSAELLTSSSRWEITFADETAYATINGMEFETTVSQVNIWQRYQESIENA